MARSDRGHDEPAEWADRDGPGPTPPGEAGAPPGSQQVTDSVVQVNTEDEQTIGGGSEPVREARDRGGLSPLPAIAFAGLALLILVVVLLAVLVGFHALA